AGGSSGSSTSGGSGSGGESGSGGTGASGAGGRTVSLGGSSGAGGRGGAGGSGGSNGTGGATARGGAGGSGGAGGKTGAGGSGGAGGSAGGVVGSSGGVGGLVGSGGTTVPKPSRGPAPATAGHKYPFPQNRENSRCVYPTLYRNEDVQAAYTQWKNDTVTSDGANGFRRVKRPNEPGLEQNSTVSEGIGYGMLLAVYMDDQSLFDDLWKYEQAHLDTGTYLMNWYIKADGSGIGSNPSGAGPATDADEDMALALVMADKQWGGKGSSPRTYIDWAQETIGKIWSNEVNSGKYLLPWPATGVPGINLSYFAPAYYKVFAKIDTANASGWNTLTSTMYGVLNATLNSSNGNADNGLVPAWSDTSGKPNGGAFGATGGASPTNYQYDSCRVPFRIGLDYCWTGDTTAQAYVAKTSKFFSGIGATKIVDGYDLNGTAHAQYQTGTNAQIQSSAFVGPAGVGAMSSSSYQTFVNDAYGVLVTGKALVGGTYYDDSWMVLSLLMMTANFLDYTSL
ncbi:MAG TPA: glycosyl hydrolase family 8, partial [Polyangia bacterium]